MKITGIYGLQNKINGKWYIGKSNNIKSRWNSYKRAACKSQIKLYYALKKYGYDNFDKIILEECDKLILGDREIYWIKEKDSFKNGYNSSENTTGGVAYHSDETKTKISQALVGRPKSEEWKQKIALTATWIGKVSLEARKRADDKRRGITRPDWVKNKISQAKIGTKRKYLPDGSFCYVKVQELQ